MTYGNDFELDEVGIGKVALVKPQKNKTILVGSLNKTDRTDGINKIIENSRPRFVESFVLTFLLQFLLDSNQKFYEIESGDGEILGYGVILVTSEKYFFMPWDDRSENIGPADCEEVQKCLPVRDVVTFTCVHPPSSS